MWWNKFRKLIPKKPIKPIEPTVKGLGVTHQELPVTDAVPAKEKNITEDTAFQIKYASMRLTEAYKAGLFFEVLVSALQEMKERKGELFVCAAIDAGCKEWDV